MAQLNSTTVNGKLTTGTASITGTLTVNGTNVGTKISLLDSLNTKITNMFGGAYGLTVTSCTAGSNYTVSDYSATLTGNVLRVYFNVTRKSATSGNISNEDVCSFVINTGGKIAAARAATFTNSTAGGNASFVMTSTSVSGNNLTFGVQANAYAQNTTSTNAHFLIPVKLNMSAY